MNKSLSIIFQVMILQASFAQSFTPVVQYGKLVRINISSKYITERPVDVWLPENYSSKKKYAVLYMHDGQMLFDETQTWNKQSWQVDSVATSVMNQKGIKSFIVVAVWNNPQTRHSDYFPQEPFETLSQNQKDNVSQQLNQAISIKEAFVPNSDNYLKFLITELKPYIDSAFSVNTDIGNTFIAGSSMGGLISWYALCKYPDIFGGATCLSTHWPGTFTLENNPMPDSFIDYLKKNLPDPQKYKLYFDCGDKTLDAMYPPIQKRVDEVLKQKGFIGKSYLSKIFHGEVHDEKAWAKRLHVPLLFLLNNNEQTKSLESTKSIP